MTTSEVKVAETAAIRRARSEHARVTARATVGEAASSAASPSAAPRPCTSGRLLHITMVGTFPRHRYVDGPGSAPVSGQVMTVDATTGQVCETHYLSGPVVTDTMSVVLFAA